MREGWIPLECVECGEQWEGSPEELPPPGEEFACPHCDTHRPVQAFVSTPEGLEILAEFHE